MRALRLTPFFHPSPRGGQSLIEVMIAVTALTVSFLGISALLAQSLALNRVISNEATATYLASEGIEMAKSLIDHDFYAYAATPPQGLGWGSCFGFGGDFELDYTTPDCSALTRFVAGGRYLWYNPTTHLYSYDQDGAQQTDFTRDIRVTSNGDEITVNSIVSWSGLAGSPGSINLEDHFYKWY